MALRKGNRIGGAVVLGLGAWLSFGVCPLQAQDDAVRRAMRDELKRSMEGLRIANLDKPYFIAYRIHDRQLTEASATFGSLVETQDSRSRLLSVEVRVGDYDFDNTNFMSFPSFGGSRLPSVWAIAQLPLEDDYKEIRRQLWLATDAAYKHAVETLAGKRAALENKTRTDNLPDFSKEDAVVFIEKGRTEVVDPRQAEGLVRRLSAIFRSMPDVSTDRVELTVRNDTMRYLTSEGTEIVRPATLVALNATARALSMDGMPITDFRAAYGHSMAELPKEEEFGARIREMCQDLSKLRVAPLAERYNGPILFEGQAAAEVFAQVMGGKFLGGRRPVSDNPAFEMFSVQAENSFQNRFGARVMPDSLGVLDDPTRGSFLGAPLLGGYTADDDGVRGRPTTLVDKGILRTVLTSRDPVQGVPRSTGNRRGMGPGPSNLIVTVQNGLSSGALKEKLLGLVKQRGMAFGILVRRVQNPLNVDREDLMMGLMRRFMPGPGHESTPVADAILAYKVFPDGHEDLIRNAQFEGFSDGSFKDIAGWSQEEMVYTTPFLAFSNFMFTIFTSGASPSEDDGPVVSFAVPSMLFEDAGVKPPGGAIQKPPLLKHPFFEH